MKSHVCKPPKENKEKVKKKYIVTGCEMYMTYAMRYSNANRAYLSKGYYDWPCIFSTTSLKPLIFAHSRLTLSARGVSHRPAAIIVRE